MNLLFYLFIVSIVLLLYVLLFLQVSHIFNESDLLPVVFGITDGCP